MAPSNKPDHTNHGQIHHPSNDKNTWTKDTKTKTAACRVCGTKVSVWSWQCDQCSRRICSVCCERDPTDGDFQKQSAKDQIQNGCWCKRFPSNLNPAMKKFMTGLPPKQEEQLAKDRESKRKATETSAKRKAAAATAATGPSGSFTKKQTLKPSKSAVKTAADDGESDDEDIILPSTRKSLRPRPEHMTYQEADSDGGSSGSVFEEFAKASGATNTTTAQGLSGAGSISRALINSIAQQSALSPLRKPTNKRTSTAAQLDDADVFSAALSTVKKARPASSLEDGHTMILGGGVIGLFTAHELATRCMNERINHQITVVEIRAGVCELASGQCAGFLTAHGMPDDPYWQSLYAEARDAWIRLIQAGHGHNAGLISGQSGRSFFAQPNPNGNADCEEKPRWFQPGYAYTVGEDPMTSLRLDPTRLAQWLMGQCRSMGVVFRFGQCPMAVNGTRDATNYQVQLGLLGSNDPELDEFVECSHLILTAGPFTTYLANHLFNDGKTMRLRNTHSQYPWLEVPHGMANGKEAETGITVATPPADTWSTGRISMVVRPGSQVVRVSAAEKANKAQNVATSDVLQPPAASHQPFRELASDSLGYNSRANVPVQRYGSAQVSVAGGGRPYIDLLRVPGEGDGSYKEMPRVWLNYGFGRWGTTVAPAAAKALVELMM